ncbi:hypothetical protein [Roseibium sp. RKSG952]|uniref:hypothetical protein n=1 Tax=Roseibium sp. RKSG952 TaxID=2529384 RepID=UPI0012BBA3C9|nr:hypothetical protein [Roseibium sp. RKSG952]MTH98999.1 hypothetical protein [Roseibium sp. RKSG952]
MLFRRFAFAALIATATPAVALAQSAEPPSPDLSVELNTVEDIDAGCLLTFLVSNQTGVPIESAVYELVVFDASGSVLRLTVNDMGELPADRHRVRRFVQPDTTCDNLGRVLINGTNACTVDGAESEICSDALSLSSRVDVELFR